MKGAIGNLYLVTHTYEVAGGKSAYWYGVIALSWILTTGITLILKYAVFTRLYYFSEKQSTDAYTVYSSYHICCLPCLVAFFVQGAD